MQGFDPPQVVSQADIADDQWHHVAFSSMEQKCSCTSTASSRRSRPPSRQAVSGHWPAELRYQLGVAIRTP
jgi:hypothetical protein